MADTDEQGGWETFKGRDTSARRDRPADRIPAEDPLLAALAGMADDLRDTTNEKRAALERRIVELKAAGYNHRELAAAVQVRSQRIYQILHKARPEEDLNGTGSNGTG